jgi:hypothetical protein
MRDYTWQAKYVERHFDSHGLVESTKGRRWETLIVGGQVYSRTLERDGRPVSPEDQRKEQARLDQASIKLRAESPADRQHRLDESRRQNAREWGFLSEIPDLFDLRLDGDSTMDGRSVWVVSGSPRADARPKSRNAKMLLKVRGRLWIDKTTYQWARVEAETTGVISWGVFLARLDSGGKLIFEQAEASSDLLLPKRLFLAGSGRLGLVKRLTEDQELQWTNYKRFSVDSKIVPDPASPQD